MAIDDNTDPEFDSLVDSSDASPSLLPPLPAVSVAPASLAAFLPPAPSLILSIGSGTGLLEALLLAEPYSLNVIGVEVQPSVNCYLPTLNHRAVIGTHALEPLATAASAWLFIYPRRVGLLEGYLATHGKGAVQLVVWIGPTADWQDYSVCFGSEWDVQVKGADEVGGKAWDLIAITTKKPT